jgi:zinc resistance-associated protein
MIITIRQTKNNVQQTITQEGIMKKSLIIISSILLVAFVAGNVFAWGQGHGMMGGGQGGQGGQNCQGISGGQNCQGFGGQNGASNITPEQSAELTKLRQTFTDDTYELRSAKFSKQQEMRMLMQTSDPDRAKLNTLSKEVSELQNQLRNKSLDFQLAAKKIAPEFGQGAGFGRGMRGGGQGSGCRNQ